MAAGQHDLKAKLELAELYLSTKPRTTRNMRQALRHLYRVALQFSCGDEQGKCLEGEKARERLVQIAHAGSVEAMYLLGRIYMTVMEDAELRGKAKSWLSGAASEGHARSAELLEEYFGRQQGHSRRFETEA